MTKIKNTKKGMAKKTLSMSLVVAMLATSNVPVWAAEFSDGSDAAVTAEAAAPVVDDTEEFSDATAEAPVVDDATEEVSTAQVAADYKVTTNMELKDIEWSKGLDFSKKASAPDADAEEFKVEDKNGLSKSVTKVEIYTDAGKVKDVTVSAGQTVKNALLADANKLDVTIYKTSTNKKVWAKFYVDGENEAVYTTNEATIKPVAIDKDWKVALKTAGSDIVTYNGKKQSPEIVVSKDGVTASTTVKFVKVTEAQDVGTYKYYAEGVEADGFVGTTNNDNNPEFKINPVKPSDENLSVVISGNATYNGKNAKPKVVLTDKLTNKVIPEELYTVKVKDDKTKVGSYTKEDLTITLKEKEKIGTATEFTNNNFGEIENGVYKNTTDVAPLATGEYKINALDLSKLGDTYTITMEARTKGAANPTLADVKFVDKKTGKTVAATEALPYSYNVNGTTKSDVQVTVSGADKVGTGILTIEPTAEAKTAGTVTGSYAVNFSVVSGIIDKSAVGFPENTKIGDTVLKSDSTDKAPFALDSTKVKNAIDAVLGNDTNGNPKVVYNSTAIEPLKDAFSKLELTVKTPTVTPETLVLGTDYDITYSDNTDSFGVSNKMAKITLTFKGKYTGKIEYEFKIAKATVTVTPQNVEYTAGKTSYDAAAKVETEVNGKKVAVPEKDYTITTTQKATLANGSKATGVVRFENKNYTISNGKDSDGYAYKEIESTVDKKDISKCTASVEGSYVYTGEAISPKLVVKDGNVTLKEGTDYTIISTTGANAGDAVVTVKGNGWYKGTLDVKYTIAKANLANATVNDKKEKKLPYNGYPVVDVDSVVSSVKIGNTKLTKYNPATKTGDYVITLDDNATNVGTYNFTIKAAPGNSRVEGEYKGTFQIVASKQSGHFAKKLDPKTDVSVSRDAQGAVIKDPQGNAVKAVLGVSDTGAYYTGKAITIDSFKTKLVVADNNNNVLTEGKDYVLKYKDNVDAGTATVEAFGLGNYKYINTATGKEEAFATLQYTIVQKDVITSDMIQKINDVEYAGGLAVEPQVVILDAKGNRLTQGVDYTVETTVTDVSAEKVTRAGNVTIKGKGAYVVGTKTKDAKGVVTITPNYTKNASIIDDSHNWKVTKKDLANTAVSVAKDNKVTVMNGSVVVPSTEYDVKFSEDGKKVTVTAKADSKNYKGYKEITVESAKVGQAMIANVVVKGNTVTPVLSSEVDEAVGYDYVIATEEDYKNGRVDISKNVLKTNTDFHYVQQGTYYAYCHAWKRNAEGKKVFGEWSNIYKFTVKATTPSKPSIKSVKVKGHTVTVTFTASENAKGYDVVLGEAVKKVNGENRPVEYGKLVVKNIEDGVYTATFHNVPDGKYYAGVHSYNKTSEDGKKVFSKWGYKKEATSVGKAK